MSSSHVSAEQGAQARNVLRHGILAILRQPVCVSILFVAGLNSIASIFALRGDKYEGADAAGVRSFLSGEYRSEVLRALGLMLALSIIIGLLLGLFVSGALRIRQAWLNLERASKYPLSVRSSLGVVLIYLLVWVDDIVARPALYQDTLFNTASRAAGVQVFLTNHLNRPWLWTCVIFIAIGWFVSPVIGGRGHKLNWPILVMTLGAIFGATILLVFPWNSSANSRLSRRTDGRLNVLIIAADSLRPDRISPTIAPHMSELARNSVVFSNVYTPLARTFPAWVSLLTGKYPHHHGVRNMFPRWETRMQDFQAIPVNFATEGYATSVISDFAGDIFRRIDLGFANRITPTFTMRELLLERILQRNVTLLPWLRSSLARWLIPTVREMHVASDAELVTDDTLAAIDNSDGHPFFATVFYSTTHFPYAAPAPYYNRFTSPNYNGRYRYAKADTLFAEPDLTQSDIEQVRHLFDGAVAAVDTAVGRLLSGLAARGLTDHTVVVLTADHGETLYENNHGQGHGDHLFGDENLHVPLFIVKPFASHADVPTPLSSVDLAPTLCDLTQVKCSQNMDGKSFAAVFVGQAPEPRPVYAETGLWFTETSPEVPANLRIPYPDLIHLTEIDRSHSDEVVIRRNWDALTTAAKHRMIRDERYKLVYMPTRRGPKYELFDTQLDPAETTDIAASQPSIADRLKGTLMQWISSDASMEVRGDVVTPRLSDETVSTK